MIAKTTGGLIGANVAMNEIRTPMKVFKEARARGDTATMERAMGYVNSLNEDAWKYKKSADDGLKEEAVEAKEKERLEREELAARIKENREESEKRLEDASENTVVTDTEGASETKADCENASEKSGSDIELSTEHTEIDSVDAPVTYTKTGEVVSLDPEIKLSVRA